MAWKLAAGKTWVGLRQEQGIMVRDIGERVRATTLEAHAAERNRAVRSIMRGLRVAGERG